MTIDGFLTNSLGGTVAIRFKRSERPAQICDWLDSFWPVQVTEYKANYSTGEATIRFNWITGALVYDSRTADELQDKLFGRFDHGYDKSNRDAEKA